ncbi:M23 family metallopeptidase [Culicoidibacter larvae]|nr:M23 family metallopeptidase [Culicoidibacter larvae]
MNRINKYAVPLMNGIIFLAIACLLITLGILVFDTGLLKATIWIVMKMFYPFVGIFLVVFALVMLIIIKGKVVAKLLLVALATLYLVPLLLLINIIYVPYPADLATTEPQLIASWPFKNPTVVGWGGDDPQGNLPHAIWASERWAYDIVSEPYNTGSTNLEAYGIYGEKVYAPVSGTIVQVVIDEPDVAPNTDKFSIAEGNHVYIHVAATDSYVLLSHLKQGTIDLKVGDSVEVGDYIGEIGNSGSTSEPHLHMHHQKQHPKDVLIPTAAIGLPLYFKVDGNVIMPEKDMIIKP